MTLATRTIGYSTLAAAAERLAADHPRLHASIRDMDVLEDSPSTGSLGFDGNVVHVASGHDGSDSEANFYDLACLAELVAMDALGRTGVKDSRTWNMACMIVAVGNLRMTGVHAPTTRYAAFDKPMYDGMKASSLYDRLVELDRGPTAMIGLMNQYDLPAAPTQPEPIARASIGTS